MRSHNRTMQNLTMQRRHFQLIAAVLSTTKPSAMYPSTPMAEWAEIVRAMACALERTNPKFDRRAFLAACDAAVEG